MQNSKLYKTGNPCWLDSDYTQFLKISPTSVQSHSKNQMPTGEGQVAKVIPTKPGPS